MLAPEGGTGANPLSILNDDYTSISSNKIWKAELENREIFHFLAHSTNGSNSWS